MTGFSDRWRAAAAPTLADIEALAREAYARLPEQFRAMCRDLVIRVEDFPTEEVVESMKLDSEFDLLGLFQGVGLPFQSEMAPTHMPNMIWLYRRPILDYWAEHEDSLSAIVTHARERFEQLRTEQAIINQTRDTFRLADALGFPVRVAPATGADPVAEREAARVKATVDQAWSEVEQAQEESRRLRGEVLKLEMQRVSLQEIEKELAEKKAALEKGEHRLHELAMLERTLKGLMPQGSTLPGTDLPVHDLASGRRGWEPFCEQLRLRGLAYSPSWALRFLLACLAARPLGALVLLLWRRPWRTPPSPNAKRICCSKAAPRRMTVRCAATTCSAMAESILRSCCPTTRNSRWLPLSTPLAAANPMARSSAIIATGTGIFLIGTPSIPATGT